MPVTQRLPPSGSSSVGSSAAGATDPSTCSRPGRAPDRACGIPKGSGGVGPDETPSPNPRRVMSRVILIGGHGKVALLAAPLLVSDGHDVTSVVRNPDHVADVEATGATAAVLDIEHATTGQIADLVRGSDIVVWSAGAGGGSPERTYAVDRDAAIRSMDAAAEAGVRRYVMVSYLGAGPDHGVPADNSFHAYAEAKAAADAHLRGSGLEWTILGPGALTDGPGNGLLDVNPADTSDGTGTSRANVALVAAAALGLPQTAGRTIEFRDGTLPLAAALEPVKYPRRPGPGRGLHAGTASSSSSALAST